MQKILFITNSPIGDAFLTTGVLSYLERTYPKAHFTIAAGIGSLELFKSFPRLERLIPIEKKPYKKHWFDLWWACIRESWDLVVDLRSSTISYFLFTKNRKILNTPTDLKKTTQKVEQLSRLFNLEELPKPTLWTEKAQQATANKLLGKGSVIAIAPFTSPAKRWPFENCIKLLQELTNEKGLFPKAKIALIGSTSEREDLPLFLNAFPKDQIVDLVGTQDLLTLYEVLKKCKLFIGNDSGPMHLAAASGIPTICLFGPYGNQAVYAPLWASNAVVITSLQTPAEVVSLPVMEDITVEKVLDHAKNIVKT